jgi:hypothetical protein
MELNSFLFAALFCHKRERHHQRDRYGPKSAPGADKDNAFQTSRLNVQSRTGTAEKGSARTKEKLD